jgi:hypothetical protein
VSSPAVAGGSPCGCLHRTSRRCRRRISLLDTPEPVLDEGWVGGLLPAVAVPAVRALEWLLFRMGSDVTDEMLVLHEAPSAQAALEHSQPGATPRSWRAGRCRTVHSRRCDLGKVRRNRRVVPRICGGRGGTLELERRGHVHKIPPWWSIATGTDDWTLPKPRILKPRPGRLGSSDRPNQASMAGTRPDPLMYRPDIMLHGLGK